MLKEEVCGKRVHALSPQEDEVMASVHGDVDGGDPAIRVVLVSPQDGSVAVNDLELELECTIKVQAIDRHLARVGDRSGGEGLSAGGENEEGEKRNEVSRHAPNPNPPRAAVNPRGGQPLHGGGAVGVVSL